MGLSAEGETLAPPHEPEESQMADPGWSRSRDGLGLHWLLCLVGAEPKAHFGRPRPILYPGGRWAG
jgi:hypothetical protein